MLIQEFPKLCTDSVDGIDCMEQMNKINDNKSDNIFLLSWRFFCPHPSPADRFFLVWYWNLMFICDSRVG